MTALQEALSLLEECRINVDNSGLLKRVTLFLEGARNYVEPMPVAYDVLCDGASCGNIYQTLTRAQENKRHRDMAYPGHERVIRPLYSSTTIKASAEIERNSMFKLSNFVADNWTMKKYTLVEIEDGLRSSIAAITATKDKP